MGGIQVCNKFACVWMCMQLSMHMDVDIHIGSENMNSWSNCLRSKCLNSEVCPQAPEKVKIYSSFVILVLTLVISIVRITYYISITNTI